MSDETKPQLHITTPAEIVALYEQLYDREWNKETGAFKNPIVVSRTLVHLGRLCASRLIDVVKRVVDAEVGVRRVEARAFEIENRLAALEAFKEEAEQYAQMMMQQFMSSGGDAQTPAAPPVVDTTPTVGVPVELTQTVPEVATVTPITAQTDSKDKSKKNKTAGQNGAA